MVQDEERRRCTASPIGVLSLVAKPGLSVLVISYPHGMTHTNISVIDDTELRRNGAAYPIVGIGNAHHVVNVHDREHDQHKERRCE